MWNVDEKLIQVAADQHFQCHFVMYTFGLIIMRLKILNSERVQLQILITPSQITTEMS